jgi:hypothetical protein
MRRGREDSVVPGEEGRERRNSKRKTDSREERPMILTSIRQTKSEKQNKQDNVCKFHIEFLHRICPPYNIQIDNFIPSYRKKYH